VHIICQERAWWGWCSPNEWSGGGALVKTWPWIAGSNGEGGQMVPQMDEGDVEVLR
jgi:hypothetical protein